MTATAPQPPQPHPHGDAAAELMPGLAGPTPTRRNRLRPWLVVALAAVAAITAAVPVAIAGLAHHAPIWPAAPADYLTWGTTGDAADDHSLAKAAAAAWQRDNGHDHHEILPLLQRRSPVGTLAIVQGRDDTGRPRLAILTGVPDDPADPRLVLRADRPLANPAAIRQVSMVTAQLGERPGRLPEHRGRALMLALAAPGADQVSFTSAVLDPAELPPAARGRLATVLRPDTVSAFTTGIRIRTGNRTVDVPADDDAIGALHARPLTDVHRLDPHTLTATVDAARPGQFIASRAGAVGVITDAGDHSATVRLLTDPETHLSTTGSTVTSAIVGVDSGHLAVIGYTNPPAVGDLLRANVSNTRTEYVPVGRVLATQHAGDPGSLPVAPTADLDNPGQLYLLTGDHTA